MDRGRRRVDVRPATAADCRIRSIDEAPSPRDINYVEMEKDSVVVYRANFLTWNGSCVEKGYWLGTTQSGGGGYNVHGRFSRLYLRGTNTAHNEIIIYIELK